MDLQNLVNETLQKIRRNMMLVQQLEQLLKYVIVSGSTSGYLSEIEENKAKQVEALRKQTMGQLVGQYVENNAPDFETNFDESDELKEAHFIVMSVFVISRNFSS